MALVLVVVRGMNIFSCLDFILLVRLFSVGALSFIWVGCSRREENGLQFVSVNQLRRLAFFLRFDSIDRKVFVWLLYHDLGHWIPERPNLFEICWRPVAN